MRVSEPQPLSHPHTASSPLPLLSPLMWPHRRRRHCSTATALSVSPRALAPAPLTGLFNTRQVLLATFDQALHTLPAIPATATEAEVEAARGEANTEALLRRLHDEVLGIPMTPGTNFAGEGGASSHRHRHASANVTRYAAPLS